MITAVCLVFARLQLCSAPFAQKIFGRGWMDVDRHSYWWDKEKKINEYIDVRVTLAADIPI